MKVSPPIRILAAGLVLASLLVVLVIREDRARAAGTEVVLAMEAVDPRELLTGHYVALRLTQRLATGEPCFQRVQTYSEGGWLGLRRDGDQHRFVGSGRTAAAALQGGGDVAIRGGVYCNRVAFDGQEGWAVTLDLGVDRFHIDQEEAERIEKVLRDRRVGQPANAFAVISAGRDGRARLKGIILEGRRTDITWW